MKELALAVKTDGQWANVGTLSMPKLHVSVTFTQRKGAAQWVKMWLDDFWTPQCPASTILNLCCPASEANEDLQLNFTTVLSIENTTALGLAGGVAAVRLMTGCFICTPNSFHSHLAARANSNHSTKTDNPRKSAKRFPCEPSRVVELWDPKTQVF